MLHPLLLPTLHSHRVIIVKGFLLRELARMTVIPGKSSSGQLNGLELVQVWTDTSSTLLLSITMDWHLLNELSPKFSDCSLGKSIRSPWLLDSTLNHQVLDIGETVHTHLDGTERWKTSKLQELIGLERSISEVNRHQRIAVHNTCTSIRLLLCVAWHRKAARADSNSL